MPFEEQPIFELRISRLPDGKFDIRQNIRVTGLSAHDREFLIAILREVAERIDGLGDAV